MSMLSALEHGLAVQIERFESEDRWLLRVDLPVTLLRRTAEAGLPFGERSVRSAAALLSAALGAPVFVEAAEVDLDQVHLGFSDRSFVVFVPLEEARLWDTEAVMEHNRVRWER